jgi:hypothetical protein
MSELSPLVLLITLGYFLQILVRWGTCAHFKSRNRCYKRPTNSNSEFVGVSGLVNHCFSSLPFPSFRWGTCAHFKSRNRYYKRPTNSNSEFLGVSGLVNHCFSSWPFPLQTSKAQSCTQTWSCLVGPSLTQAACTVSASCMPIKVIAYQSINLRASINVTICWSFNI